MKSMNLRWVCAAAVVLGLALAQMRVGSWTFSSSTDPVTNVRTALLYVTANEASETALVVGCTSDRLKLSVTMTTHRYVASDKNVRVLWRFDTDASPTEGQVWAASRGTWLYFFGHENALVQKLSVSNTLAMRVYTYLGDSYTYTFNVGGFAEALKLLPCSLP